MGPTTVLILSQEKIRSAASYLSSARKPLEVGVPSFSVTDSTQSNGCSSFDGLRPSPRRHNPAKMPDYKQMLKEAEEREAGVKKVFQQYDVDGGGSIDPGEITCVMEDLGLLNGLKTDVTAFVAAAFARYDENDDGALSFEVHPPPYAPLTGSERRAATERAR